MINTFKKNVARFKKKISVILENLYNIKLWKMESMEGSKTLPSSAHNSKILIFIVTGGFEV